MTAVGGLADQDASPGVVVPQYGSTSDPAVIAVVEANHAGRQAFHAAALAFAEKYGNHPQDKYLSRASGTFAVVGICGDKPTAGVWAAVAGPVEGWRPGKRNTLLAEMEAITHTDTPIPGLSEAYDGSFRSDGRQMVLFPRLFVHDGVAWFRLPEPPLEEQMGMWGTGEFDTTIWTPARASQWHAAHEAYTDALALLHPATPETEN